MIAVQMMSPIDTENWAMTSKVRIRPVPGVSAAERFAFSTRPGWKRDR